MTNLAGPPPPDATETAAPRGSAAPRALVLFGGGLDGRLACELLARRGVEVACVHFDTAFVDPARRAHVDACVAAGRFPVDVVPVFRDWFRAVVLEPRHPAGRALNRCLDCRTFLLGRAAAIARGRGIALLATGDVVGQRALDQSRAALARADADAGVRGRVLRPLSAGLLPDTPVPLDRSVRLHGRTRRAQLDLAARLGIDDAPPPRAGCCRLADPRYAARLRDLLAHRDASAIGRADVERLALGRHVRLGWDLKVVVGRDEADCRALERRAGTDAVASAADGRGALAVVEGAPDASGLAAVAAVVARYAGPRPPGPVQIVLRRPGEPDRRLAAHPATDAWISARLV